MYCSENLKIIYNGALVSHGIFFYDSIGSGKTLYSAGESCYSLLHNTNFMPILLTIYDYLTKYFDHLISATFEFYLKEKD